MKVFIFGAGASQGSQYPMNKIESLAPLTGELLDEIYIERAKEVDISLTEFQSLRAEYTDYLKVNPNKTLEDWLTEKWVAISGLRSPQSRNSEYIQFGKLTNYIWNLLMTISNGYEDSNFYTKLIRNLKGKDEEFSIVSFNYDVFIERALQTIYGRRYDSLKDYHDDELPVIKPHGSINWYLPKRPSDPGIGSEWNFEMKTRYRLSSEKMYVGDKLEFDETKFVDPGTLDSYKPESISRSRFTNEYFFPVIILPMKEKEYSRLIGFSEKIVEKAKEVVKKAKEIYLVGYKAQDKVIFDIFKEVQPETLLTVVGHKSAIEIGNRVSKRIPNFKQKKPFIGEFKDFVLEDNLY